MAWLRLGSANPTGGELTPLFINSEGKQVTCSTLQVCNMTDRMISFKIAYLEDGAAVQAKDYLYFQEEVRPFKSFAATLGWTLNSNSAIWCSSNSSSVAFNLFGVIQNNDSEEDEI